MYPQIPVQTKVRMFPYLLIIAVLITAAETPEAAPTRAAGTTASAPSQAARADIPRHMLTLYRTAGRGETWKAGQRPYAAWAVLAGVGKVESNHCRHPGTKPGGSSSAGALGCMQFMPGTWPGYGRGNIYDPRNSIPAARRYLLAHGARKNLEWALAAYNAGPGRADNPPAVTRRYVANVRALARQYEKGA